MSDCMIALQEGEVPTLEQRFRAGADVSKGLSGRATMDASPYDYKDDRRLEHTKDKHKNG